jgi:hypothetical protein
MKWVLLVAIITLMVIMTCIVFFFLTTFVVFLTKKLGKVSNVKSTNFGNFWENLPNLLYQKIEKKTLSMLFL